MLHANGSVHVISFAIFHSQQRFCAKDTRCRPFPGTATKGIREKQWGMLELSKPDSRTRSRTCRQYAECRTRRIMHTHVRGMSTQWGDRGAAGPREDGHGHRHGKDCCRAVREGEIIHTGQDCCVIRHHFLARARFGEDTYVPWRTWVHHAC